MDIPQLITTLGVCGLVCYGVWWALQRVKAMPANGTPVAPLSSGGDEIVAKVNNFLAVRDTAMRATTREVGMLASLRCIREGIAQDLMPLPKDNEVEDDSQ